MKKIILLFFIFFSFSTFAQQSIILKYERADVNYDGAYYAKLLNIDNKNSLILKLEDEKFIVYDDSGVYRFYIDWDKSINKKKLATTETKMCFTHLDSLKSINPYNLNVTRQAKTDSLHGTDYIDVQDGFSYRLSLFKNDLTVNYETYSPEIYIEEKFPFYKEREKLLNACKYFASLFRDAEASENCGVMNEILHSPQILEYFNANCKHTHDLYLLENDLCNVNLKINKKFSVTVIKKERVKKGIHYLSVSSVNSESDYKIITMEYPIKAVSFTFFTVNGKVKDVKVLKNLKSND